MAKEKTASQILLAGGLVGTAGYGLYRNSQERKYKPGQKKSLTQRFGGLAGAGISGYLGYKLDKARGGSGAKGAAIGAGGFLAVQKLGIGKTLGAAALAGTAYLAYKAMPTSTKENIKNSAAGKYLTEKAGKLKHTFSDRGNIQRMIHGYVKNLARYEITQGIKSIGTKLLGGGPAISLAMQQVAQLTSPFVRDVTSDALKSIPTGGGKNVGDHLEEFKNPRLKTVDKMQKSGQIEKMARQQGKDPKVMYESMKKGARDKGYVHEALGSVSEHRAYLKGIHSESLSIDKKLKAGNLSAEDTQALKKRKFDLEKGKLDYRDKIYNKAAKLREKGILGIEKGDSEQVKAQKKVDKRNELVDSSNYISIKQQKLAKKREALGKDPNAPTTATGKTPAAKKAAAKKSNVTTKAQKKAQKEKALQAKKMKAAQTLKPNKMNKKMKSGLTATGSSLAKRPKLAPIKKMRF